MIDKILRGISIHADCDVYVCLLLFDFPDARTLETIVGLTGDIFRQECARLVVRMDASCDLHPFRIQEFQGSQVALLCFD